MATNNHPTSERDIVIIGAGIIGCATAYYLSQDKTRARKIHLVDASPELFTSASGKAGGFLASDWFGQATASLGKLSFRLHQELAAQHGGRANWGFSFSTGTSLTQSRSRYGPRGEDWLLEERSRAETAAVHDFKGPDGGPAWLARNNGDSLDIISGDNTVAQVDPLRLAKFLLKEATAAGVQLHHPAIPIAIRTDQSGRLDGVEIEMNGENKHIPCSGVLISAGSWSGKVFKKLFPTSSLNLGIGQLAGHSLVIKSEHWSEQHENDGCHAVFTTEQSGFSPEIISRIGGEIYIAGLNDPNLQVPDLPQEATVDEKSIRELEKVTRKLIAKDGGDSSDLKIVRKGLCFRPTTRTGNPILSSLPDKRLGIKTGDHGGVWLATGHGPWGISHSLATGLVMSEMIDDKEPSADIGMLGIA